MTEYLARPFSCFSASQIDAPELKATLNAMGQNPTEEEIFQMISQVDDDNSGEIEFAEFLKVIENQKTTAAKANDETDTLDAFIALGGHPDKTGEIASVCHQRITVMAYYLKKSFDIIQCDTKSVRCLGRGVHGRSCS